MLQYKNSIAVIKTVDIYLVKYHMLLEFQQEQNLTKHTGPNFKLNVNGPGIATQNGQIVT